MRNPDRTMALNTQSITSALKEPTVLALDSAGSGCSVVVSTGETVLAAERCTTAHGCKPNANPGETTGSDRRSYDV